MPRLPLSEKELQALLDVGLTASVQLPDGLWLRPWPIDWLLLTEEEVGFWWTGAEEEQPHRAALETLAYDEDDGTIRCQTKQGQRWTFELLWQSREREAWRRWLAGRKGGSVQRNYPEEGLRCAASS